MRKLLLLIPVMLVLLVSGCTTQDAKEIIRESTEKLEALDSYKASYDLSMSTYGMIIGGSIDIYKKGNKTRADMVMSVMGQTQSASTYELPDGTYSCTEAAGSMTCVKGQSQSTLNPEDTAIINTEMIEKGIVVLTFNNIANIAGRNCYNITSDFDFSKLSELDSEEMEALGGMALIEGLFGALGASTTFGMSQCYGFETGMPLEIIIVIEMDMSSLPSQDVTMPEKISISIKMTATSFEPDAVIADSVFELPVEPSPEIQQFCTDSETQESMSYLQARSIALESDCMEEGNIIEGTESCNSDTGTWWIDMDLEKEGCSPACVVSIPNKTAEINWRCTGVIPE